MWLLVSLTCELAACIATWALVGQLLRGPDHDVLSAHVSALSLSLVAIAETLVGIAFALVVVYWLPVLAAFVYDVRASRRVVQPPYFERSAFYVGIFTLATVVKMLLVGLTFALLTYPAADMARAVAEQLFKEDFIYAATLERTAGAVAAAQTACVVWFALHVAGLLACAYCLGEEHSKRKAA